jgi:hypothetical protein
VGTPGPRTQPTTADILDGVAASWPSPAVVERVARLGSERQDRLTRMLRRPPGTGVGGRGMLSELLLDTESLSAMEINAAALYLRCGQMDRAAEAAARFVDKPGDDPDFRQLLAAANRPTPSLPTIWRWPVAFCRAVSCCSAPPRIGSIPRPRPRSCAVGSSFPRRHRTVGAGFARGALCPGTLCWPCATSTKPWPSWNDRMLGADKIADLVSERMELAFLRLKSRIDPDRMQPVLREAETLRSQLAQSQQRFGSKHFKVSEADVDLAVARGPGGRREGWTKPSPCLLRAQRENTGDY